MWNLLLFPVLFHLLNGHPITEKTTPQKETTDDQWQPPIVVSYIKHFRNLMVHYVADVQKEKYNLTDHAMKEVQSELTEFLMTFARDLKETVLAANNHVTFETHHILKDGLPDSNFEKIKNKLRSEFPEVKEETAEEIVYKLRLNLYRTKLAINDIIELSNTPDVLDVL